MFVYIWLRIPVYPMFDPIQSVDPKWKKFIDKSKVSNYTQSFTVSPPDRICRILVGGHKYCSTFYNFGVH